MTTVGEGAGAGSEITQLPEIPGVRTAGAQDSNNGVEVAGAEREMVAAKLAPPPVAEMTALCEKAMVAAEAVNVAEAAFAGTVTVAGTDNSDGRLLERETVMPPAGAALARTTVQVVLVLDVKMVAAH